MPKYLDRLISGSNFDALTSKQVRAEMYYLPISIVWKSLKQIPACFFPGEGLIFSKQY